MTIATFLENFVACLVYRLGRIESSTPYALNKEQLALKYLNRVRFELSTSVCAHSALAWAPDHAIGCAECSTTEGRGSTSKFVTAQKILMFRSG